MTHKDRILPLHVALLRHGSEVHDHSRGYCDLQEFDEYLKRDRRVAYRRWRPSFEHDCPKVVAKFFITCHHGHPATGPNVLYFDRFKKTHFYEKHEPEMGEPDLRFFFDCLSKEFVKEVDPIFDEVGAIPPCTERRDWYSGKVDAYKPGRPGLNLVYDEAQEPQDLPEFSHVYWATVNDYSAECKVCDGEHAFSCYRELRGEYDEVYHSANKASNSCCCSDCHDYRDVTAATRREERDTLRGAKYLWNSGYDDAFDDLGLDF